MSLSLCFQSASLMWLAGRASQNMGGRHLSSSLWTRHCLATACLEIMWTGRQHRQTVEEKSMMVALQGLHHKGTMAFVLYFFTRRFGSDHFHKQLCFCKVSTSIHYVPHVCHTDNKMYGHLDTASRDRKINLWVESLPTITYPVTSAQILIVVCY